MARYEVKPLGIGGILDQTVAVVKDNFLLLFGVAAVVYVPMGLFNGLYMATQLPEPPGVMSDPQARQEYGEAVLAASVIIFPITALFAWVGAPLTYGAMIWAVSSAYLGNPASIGECWRKAWRSGISLVGANIMYGLVVSLGMFLCLVGAAVFGLWFMFYGQGIMLEGLRASASMTRSKELIKGNMSTGFVLGLILLVIVLAIYGSNMISMQQHLAAVIQVVLQLIVLTFTTAASTVFYFSCRCKHEDFDLMRLATAVEANDDAAAPQRDATF